MFDVLFRHISTTRRLDPPVTCRVCRACDWKMGQVGSGTTQEGEVGMVQLRLCRRCYSMAGTSTSNASTLKFQMIDEFGRRRWNAFVSLTFCQFSLWFSLLVPAQSSSGHCSQSLLVDIVFEIAFICFLPCEGGSKVFLARPGWGLILVLCMVCVKLRKWPGRRMI